MNIFHPVQEFTLEIRTGSDRPLCVCTTYRKTKGLFTPDFVTCTVYCLGDIEPLCRGRSPTEQPGTYPAHLLIARNIHFTEGSVDPHQRETTFTDVALSGTLH